MKRACAETWKRCCWRWAGSNVFEAKIGDITLTLEATDKLFSPRALDAGTAAMLSCVTLAPGQRVLDLGCGCGVVGIWAAKLVGAENVVLCDISREAARVSLENAARNGVPGVRVVVSDGFSALDATGFDWILCNPPYHADFSVPRAFIEKDFNRLALGGRMVLVVKRRLWYENKLRAVFGGATVREIDGYFVIAAQKRDWHYANKKTGGKHQ